MKNLFFVLYQVADPTGNACRPGPNQRSSSSANQPRLAKGSTARIPHHKMSKVFTAQAASIKKNFINLLYLNDFLYLARMMLFLLQANTQPLSEVQYENYQ